MAMGIGMLVLVLVGLLFAIRVAVGFVAMIFKIGFVLALLVGVGVFIKMFSMH